MRRFVMMAAVALVITGCTGRPDDPVFLFGAVRDEQGTALARAPLKLLRATSQQCRYLAFRERAEFQEFTGTPYTPMMEAASAEDGLFLFKLLRFQVDSTTWDWPCFQIHLEGSPTGARTIASIPGLYSGDLKMDPLYRLDHQTVTVATDGSEHVLTAARGPLEPRGPGTTFEGSLVAYEWDLTSAGKSFWRAEWFDQALRIDARVREDFAQPRVTLDLLSYILSNEQTGPFMTGSPFEQYALGPPATIPPAGAAVLPVSRGVVCAAGPRTWSPCPLTDGALDLVAMELGERASPENPQPPAPEPLTFTLSSPARPTELILRDFQPALVASEGIRVQGSSNGIDYEELGGIVLGPFDGEMSGYQYLNQGIYWMRVPLTQTSEALTHLRISGVHSFGARELSFFE